MHIVLKSFVALLFLLTLQGCWFAFIPGSVTGAVSDAVTGSEGANCVSTVAKVGDYINLASGESGRVKSLSGTSSRCRDADKPIRALIVSPNDPFFKSDAFINANPASAQTQPPSAAGGTSATIQLPVGWEKRDVAAADRKNGRFLLATSKTIDSGLAMSSISIAGVTDNEKFVQSRIAIQLGRLDNATSTPLTKTRINGYDAYQAEVTGNLKTGSKSSLAYLQTLFIGKNDVVQLAIWTTTGNFPATKSAFQEIINTIANVDQ